MNLSFVIFIDAFALFKKKRKEKRLKKKRVLVICLSDFLMVEELDKQKRADKRHIVPRTQHTPSTAHAPPPTQFILIRGGCKQKKQKTKETRSGHIC